jgi:hypothetical protein
MPIDWKTHLVRCTTYRCSSRCLNPIYAAPLVVFASTLALGGLFIESTGMKVEGGISLGTFSFASVFLILAWLAAIVIGCIKKHEDGLWCFIDSFGIPGVITAGVYGLRAFVH